MQRCGVAEERKGRQVLFSPALCDCLKEPVAQAESTPRFLMLFVVGWSPIL
jgi:hypothetical protein